MSIKFEWSTRILECEGEGLEEKFAYTFPLGLKTFKSTLPLTGRIMNAPLWTRLSVCCHCLWRVQVLLWV